MNERQEIQHAIDRYSIDQLTGEVGCYLLIGENPDGTPVAAFTIHRINDQGAMMTAKLLSQQSRDGIERAREVGVKGLPEGSTRLHVCRLESCPCGEPMGIARCLGSVEPD